MLSKKHARYKMSFCGKHSHSTFVEIVNECRTESRICWLGVEHIRMFLSVDCGIPTVHFYKREGKSWSKVTEKLRFRKMDVDQMLYSEEHFEEELCETFFFAFPRAEENYYEDLLTSKYVMSILNSSPNERGLEELNVYVIDDDRVTEDEDGIVTINTRDGHICIPYKLVNGEKHLDMSRSLFHADNLLEHAFNKVFDKLDDVKSSLSSLSIGNILHKIDKFIK